MSRRPQTRRIPDWAWEAGRGVIRAAHSGLPTSSPPLAEIRDLAVEAPESPPLRARLYRPEGGADPRPVLGFFHGGGFFSCDVDTHDDMCRWLASVSGAVVVSFDYRLAPQHRFPAQLHDAQAGADWLVARADELGVDLTRLALGGDSAGAYLAAATAARMNAARPGAVALQLLIYPLLRIDETACAEEAMAAFRFAGRFAGGFVQRQVLEPGATAAAIGGEEIAHAPATIVVSGGLDPLRGEAAAYAAALKGAGRPVTELHYPRLVHGGLNFPAVSKGALAALVEVGEALGRRLGGEPARR